MSQKYKNFFYHKGIIWPRSNLYLLQLNFSNLKTPPPPSQPPFIFQTPKLTAYFESTFHHIDVQRRQKSPNWILIVVCLQAP